MLARRRALPARGARRCSSPETRRPVARRVARATGASRARFVERRDRPAGRRRVVGRPAPDVELPRPLPRRVLRQPRDARAARAAALARGDGRLAPLRRGARRPVPRPPAARDAGARDPPPPRPRDGQAARRRARALRRGRPRHALRPGARDARRRDAARARGPRRDPVPGQRGGPPHRHGPAPAAAARVGELELPPARRPGRPADRDLPHEPPAVARGGRAVLRDAEPHGRDRPGEGDPHDRVRASRLHVGGQARPAPPRRDQRPASARTSAARTGAGASTRTASRARCGSPSALGGDAL